MTKKKKKAARKKKTTKSKPRLSADLAKALQGRIPPEVLLEFSLAILEGKSPIFVADKTAERGYRIAYSYGEVPPTLEQRQRAFKVILDMGWGPGIPKDLPKTGIWVGDPPKSKAESTVETVSPEVTVTQAPGETHINVKSVEEAKRAKEQLERGRPDDSASERIQRSARDYLDRGQANLTITLREVGGRWIVDVAQTPRLMAFGDSPDLERVEAIRAAKARALRALADMFEEGKSLWDEAAFDV